MNEYLTKVAELGGPWDRLSTPFEVEMEAMYHRFELVGEYAWAIPTDEALDLLVSLSPIVEVGAGGGYWAMLLRERGADVVAYDLAPGEFSATEHTGDGKMMRRRVWSDVLDGDEYVAADHPDRTLFLCWPQMNLMAAKALRGYLKAGGSTLVYVGEGDGGCNATDSFFQLLERRMVEQQTLYIPQWPGIHDYLSVWRRD